MHRKRNSPPRATWVASSGRTDKYAIRICRCGQTTTTRFCVDLDACRSRSIANLPWHGRQRLSRRREHGSVAQDVRLHRILAKQSAWRGPQYLDRKSQSAASHGLRFLATVQRSRIRAAKSFGQRSPRGNGRRCCCNSGCPTGGLPEERHHLSGSGAGRAHAARATRLYSRLGRWRTAGRISRGCLLFRHSLSRIRSRLGCDRE